MDDRNQPSGEDHTGRYRANGGGTGRWREDAMVSAPHWFTALDGEADEWARTALYDGPEDWAAAGVPPPPGYDEFAAVGPGVGGERDGGRIGAESGGLAIERLMDAQGLSEVAVAIGSFPCDGLDVDELAGRLEATRRLGAYLEAERMLTVAALIEAASRARWTMKAVQSHVSAVLAIAPKTAAGLVGRVLVCQGCPEVMGALAAGALGERKAAIIAEAVYGLPEPERADLVWELIELARDASPSQVDAVARRRRARLDPDGIRAARKRAVKGRRVSIFALEDSMALVEAVLPAEKARLVYSVIDTLASIRRADDGRGVDARRADALTGLFETIAASGSTPAGPLPVRQGRAAHVLVTMSAETLAGDSEDPGELEGYGPIPAEAAREIAAGATAQMAVVGSDGVLDYLDPTIHQPVIDVAAGNPDSVGGLSATVEGTHGSSALAMGPDRPDAFAASFDRNSGPAADVAPGWDPLSPQIADPANRTHDRALAIATIRDGPSEPAHVEPWPYGENTPSIRERIELEHWCHEHGEAFDDAHIQRMAHLVAGRLTASGWASSPAHSNFPTPCPGAQPERVAAMVAALPPNPWAPPAPGHGYRPLIGLVRFVLARFGQCAFVTCRTPAVACQLDHITPFTPDRPSCDQTTADNLAPLCGTHHQAKTEGAFTYRVERDRGRITWTSATGRTFTKPIPRLVI